MKPWAAIFDWDGVIVDSSAAHKLSWERLAAEERRRLPPGHFERSFGMKNEEIIPHLLGWTSEPLEVRRLSLRKEELYRQIIRQQGTVALPGVAGLLDRLHAAQVPCAIASSTHLENILCTLGAIGFGKYFREIVSAEDVERGKPAPDIFLRAAQKLDVLPSRCVVFEDTAVGIEAARRAGMKVVAVATTHSPDKLSGADRVVHSLDGLPVETLACWFDAPGRF
ncbi:MAG: HAD family phosphatase [Verrucomicrobiae bacterium]|nr:HAD family phosphatase [Verrucomicrobiae bacterium]